MIINEPLKVLSKYINTMTTIMRVNNEVNTYDESEIILVTNYDVMSEGFYDKFEELVEYTKNKNKKIYYDSTTELISEEFIRGIF